MNNNNNAMLIIRNLNQFYILNGNLKQHIESKHENQKYQCPFCEHQATQKRHLKRIIESKHENKRYPCPFCDIQLTAKRNLKQHIEAKHENERYACLFCDYTFVITNQPKKETFKYIQLLNKSLKQIISVTSVIIKQHKRSIFNFTLKQSVIWFYIFANCVITNHRIKEVRIIMLIKTLKYKLGIYSINQAFSSRERRN